jgi:putative endonuclease
VGSRTTGAVGHEAEQLAFQYLLKQGLQPIARNFRHRGGEIDLIMLHEECLVFVEVRFRESTSFARASHTVDHHKQQKIIRTAAVFGARNRRHAMRVMRFDVVAVEGTPKLSIDWIRDAFRPNNSTL